MWSEAQFIDSVEKRDDGYYLTLDAQFSKGDFLLSYERAGETVPEVGDSISFARVTVPGAMQHPLRGVAINGKAVFLRTDKEMRSEISTAKKQVRAMKTAIRSFIRGTYNNKYRDI